VSIFQWFADFKEKRRKRNISSHLKTLQNPKAIREDRMASLEFFNELDDIEVSVNALLKRFNFSIDHGIYDTREKELAMKGIIRFGSDALPLLLAHLKKSDKIAWPIKIYEKLASSHEIAEALEACLDFGDVAFDQNKVDKNYDILCHLRDYKTPDSGEKLLHFLKEHDERLRFAGAEVILAQDSEHLAAKLEHYLLDESAENIRLRQAVTEKYERLKWEIKEKEKIKIGQKLIDGYKVDPNFYIVKES